MAEPGREIGKDSDLRAMNLISRAYKRIILNFYYDYIKLLGIVRTFFGAPEKYVLSFYERNSTMAKYKIEDVEGIGPAYGENFAKQESKIRIRCWRPVKQKRTELNLPRRPG
jgi:hypothetical protein